MCRIAGLGVAAKMLENPINRGLPMSIVNTRLRRCAQVIDRCRSAADASPHWLAGLPREPSNKVFGLKDHVRGPVSIRRL